MYPVSYYKPFKLKRTDVFLLNADWSRLYLIWFLGDRRWEAGEQKWAGSNPVTHSAPRFAPQLGRPFLLSQQMNAILNKVSRHTIPSVHFFPGTPRVRPLNTFGIAVLCCLYHRFVHTRSIVSIVSKCLLFPIPPSHLRLQFSALCHRLRYHLIRMKEKNKQIHFCFKN